MFQPDVTRIKKITWPKKETDHTEIETDRFTFAGMKPKDMYKNKDFRNLLKEGDELCFWTIQCSRVAGLEWWDEKEKKWETVWFIGNDFETTEEAEKSAKAYNDFIEDEADRITAMIDAGASVAKIDLSTRNKGHSGNTYHCAFYAACDRAKNKKRAKAIRAWLQAGQPKGGPKEEQLYE